MKTAFFCSPGPDTGKEALVLAMKGFCMGCADIIPGVSGGSIALIAGIYSQLLSAIRSFDIQFLRRLFSGKFSAALEGVHLRFLLVLVTGILCALFAFAGLMNYLLNYHPTQTFSVFFGLMLASLYVVGRQVKWAVQPALLFAAGTVSAWFLVGLVPVTTPHNLPYIFGSSILAICAMILPGISGSFILLILGKYEFLISVLKSPFAMNEATGIHNKIIILVFACGIVVGLAAFSRFLRWLLARWYNQSLAFLVGLIAGSLRRIWPWKGEAITRLVNGKEYVISQPNALPPDFGGAFFFTLALMLAGAATVIVLERLAAGRTDGQD
jgi:putative membrane protein